MKVWSLASGVGSGSHEAAVEDSRHTVAGGGPVTDQPVNNRRGIENYAIVPLASSGPMEKAVDIVVARRFKDRGMSWLRRGMSALVQLRLLRLNGTWARYWARRFAALLRPWPSPV